MKAIIRKIEKTKKGGFVMSLTTAKGVVNLFRSANQIKQDLKGLTENEYRFLIGSSLELPKGAIVDAGHEYSDRETGEIKKTSSKQYRVAEELKAEEAFATISQYGVNFMQYSALQSMFVQSLSSVEPVAAQLESVEAPF